jgi:D-alanyl-D-alanine carboxypeptidase/D-alanyl-D-alanine-endopeptidase (penicillin-binding protein 4)
MGPTRRRRSLQVLVGLAVLAFVAAVVAAAMFFTTGVHGGGTRASVPPPRPPTVKPGVVPVVDTAETPSAGGLAAALAPAAADPNLGRLGGRVTDALTGKELWQVADDLPLVPASTNKVLTAAAALLTLDGQARISTRVVAGSQNPQGPIVLVGAGDPTLSAAPPGVDTWYRGAPRISDLVEQIRRSGVTPTAVQVDISAFSGPTLAPGWDPSDVDNGDIAPIESAMIDAGRIQPSTVNSRRSRTPALDAGRELAKALGMDPGAVTIATAPSGARQLAVVQSAPLVLRLSEMMDHSDNVLAECIAREVAGAINRPRSFAGAVDAVTNRLSTAHIDTAGAVLQDSSGLSVDDWLTAKTLDGTVQAAAGPDQPSLRALLDLLPIAGGSGTLADRFLDPATNQGPAGWLRAKTGSLTAINSLVGVVTDRSGRVLTFAFISNAAGPNGRNAMDALASRLWTCGCA